MNSEFLAQMMLWGMIVFLALAILLPMKRKNMVEEAIETYQITELQRCGAANHYLDSGNPIGGLLYLTSDKLIFKSQSKSLLNHETIIPLSKIKNLELTNTNGFIKNGLIISTKEDKRETFSLYNRKVWVEKIEDSLY